jgi:hypothetical protein
MSFNRQPPVFIQQDQQQVQQPALPPVFRQVPLTQESAESQARTREGMRAMQERTARFQAQLEAQRQTPEFLEQQARERAEAEIRARQTAEAQVRLRETMARVTQERALNPPVLTFANIQRTMQPRPIDPEVRAREDAEARAQLRASLAQLAPGARASIATGERKTDEIKTDMGALNKYLKYKNKYLSLKKDIFISKQKNH